jgi:hypothetical protein
MRGMIMTARAMIVIVMMRICVNFHLC